MGFFSQELANPALMLDLTNSPWLLGPKRSDMIVGMDVVRPGRISPDTGRRPVGCSIPSADRPLTSVIECSFTGRVVVRYARPFALDGNLVHQASKTELRNAIGIWPDEMLGAFMVASPTTADGGTEDLGRYLWEMRQITEVDNVSGGGATNGILTFAPAFSFTFGARTKLFCIYQKTVNVNGLLVSNGRKFWLLQNGVYTQYMDLGSDDYLGERWRGSQIANDRIMLTCDKFPPRIFRFGWDASTAESDTTSFAGIGTPVKPPDVEPLYMEPPVFGNKPSWYATDGGAGKGSLSAGDYKIKVRAVNLEDALYSRFVQVWSPDDFTTDLITAVATDAFKLHNDIVQRQAPYDAKWTFLEVWRTEADGEEYFLEGRVPIVSFKNEWRTALIHANNDGLNSLIALTDLTSTPMYGSELSISDADLNRRTPLSATDLSFGYRPPVCKESCSLQGVTVCAGVADTDADAILTQYSHGPYIYSAAATYTHSTKRVRVSDSSVPFEFYTPVAGDQIAITSIDGLAHSGIYEVDSKIDDNTIVLVSGPGADYAVFGYIRRPHLIESERIESDEDIWYSRTDMYAPESFALRTLNVSRTGDKFMGLRAVGRYGALIMADGVHLLYLGSDVLGNVTLEKHTVSSSGSGTPWPDSIAVWDRNVVWANARGPFVMRVSDDADDTGALGQIAEMDKDGAMRSWFEEAYRLGEQVDTGVDTHNGCLRFRRRASAGVNEVLQWSYRTGLWTILYDTGSWYARSKYANTTEVNEPLLYSLRTDGSAFEENYRGLTHPYDALTLQAITDGTYTVTTTKITKNGLFSTLLLGDIVRFRGAGAAYDGIWRVITACTANYIEFATVTGLAAGAEYIITPCQFKYRTASVTGQNPSNVKTLRGATIKARPGTRVVSGNWATPTGTPLSVRSYRDFYDGAVVDQNLKEMPVYEESDVTKDSQDRVSAIEAQGTSFQLEVECMESRTDFIIESIRADVREEGSGLADASATE